MTIVLCQLCKKYVDIKTDWRFFKGKPVCQGCVDKVLNKEKPVNQECLDKVLDKS